MAVITLKPCPFCQFETPTMCSRYQVVMEAEYYVVCSNCGARGPIAGYRIDATAEERAAQKWNRVE